MNIAWTHHLKTEEDKDKFRNQILGAKPVLQRQADIIREEMFNLDAAESDPKTYDTPSWSHKQADLNGYRRALRRMLKLVDLDQQQKKKLETNERPQFVRTTQ